MSSDTQTRRPHLTVEVQEAMRAQGLLPPAEEEPRSAVMPDGRLRYLVAVGDLTVSEGVSDRKTIAAQLRVIADQLDLAEDPTRKVDQHG